MLLWLNIEIFKGGGKVKLFFLAFPTASLEEKNTMKKERDTTRANGYLQDIIVISV